jgi:hypothetical protein
MFGMMIGVGLVNKFSKPTDINQQPQTQQDTIKRQKQMLDDQERYSEVKGRIERISERTDQNRAITNENNWLTDRNTSRSEGIKQIAGEVREVIRAKEQELERARAHTRLGSPSMGR